MTQTRESLRSLVSFWLLIVVVSALALAAFADVGEDVADLSTGPVDNAVRTWFLAHQNPVVYKIAYAITWVGSPTVMVLLAVVAAAFFYRRKGRGNAAVVLAAPAAGGLLSVAVKMIFGRVRPAGGLLLNELGYSFPSGHAATCAAVMVTLCYVLARERIISWPTAILIGGGVPLIVGLTRLYLDVHWMTDVVGGWSVGLFVAAMSAGLYEFLGARTRAAPDRA